jgi:hypothetical protein
VLRALAPEVRLIVGIVAIGSCLVSDPVTWAGLSWSASTLVLVVVIAWAPLRVLGKSALLAFVMLGPVFVLAPWTAVSLPDGGLPLLAPVAAPFRVFVRGLCVMVIATQVVSNLTRSDFRDALVRLPVPLLVGAIVEQVLLQTELQAREVRRIGLAMRARGVHRGFGNRLRVSLGMPQVWLGRLLFRAQRHERAMVARGFTGAPIAFDPYPWCAWDFSSVAGAVAWSVITFVVRWGGGS